MQVEYQPRPEYGLIHPLLSHVDGGLTARGGAEWLVLSTPLRLAVIRLVCLGSPSRLRAGESVVFGLHRSTLEQVPAHVWSPDDLRARLQATIAGWRSWSELHQNYQGPWADQVQHSGRVLQALTYQPSGAIVAAATTSLPEGCRRRAQLGLPLHLGPRRAASRWTRCGWPPARTRPATSSPSSPPPPPAR